MFRSATVKLTVWYLCLAMAISLIFSIVVYNIGTNEIARSVHLQSERIYNQFPVFDDNPILHSSSDVGTSDHDLLFRLILLNLVVLALAGIASYLLAVRTLEPIEEAHEQQKRFTSDVSHELRTPLTALKMESEVALMNPDISTKELKATLKSNLEEANKLELLVNSILKLTRMEADELRQNFGSIDSQKIVSEAVKEVKPLAKQRNITIEQKVADQNFHGDHESIKQLLVILLDNAIKYSGPESVIILEGQTKDDHMIFKVIDHGVGISSQSLNHIFDRFYRAENSRNKDQGHEGYGLGLSIAKMIADIHNAVITVSSAPGKGTEVEVSFPLQ